MFVNIFSCTVYIYFVVNYLNSIHQNKKNGFLIMKLGSVDSKSFLPKFHLSSHCYTQSIKVTT